MKLWQELLLAGIIYLLLCVAVFPTIFFGNNTFFLGDTYSLMVPQKLFLVDQIKQGVLPFWNPFIQSGIPVLADTSYALFYPSTLLFLWLPTSLAVSYTILGHLVFTAMGAFIAAKCINQKFILALLTGGVWMLSEPILTLNGNFTILQSLSWIPWLLVIHIKSFSNFKILFLQPFVIAMSFLAGHPQLLIYYMFAFTAYILFKYFWKSYWLYYFSSLFIVIPLLIFILIPFLELSALSTRSMSTWTEKMSGSIHPALLVHLLIPHFFSNPETGMAWGPEWGRIRMIAGYSSLPLLVGFVFLMFKKKKSEVEFFLVILFLACLIFALGKNIPILWKLYEYIPGINSFRNPAAAIGLSLLAIAILAGPSLGRFKEFLIHSNKPMYLFQFMAVGMFLILVGSSLVTEEIWQKLQLAGIHTYHRDLEIVQSASISGLIVFTSAVLVLIILKNNFPLVLIVPIIWLDLALAHRQIVFLAPPSVYDLSSPQATWIHQHNPKVYRVLSSSSYLPYTGFHDYWNNIFIRPPFGESRFSGEETKKFTGLIARQHNLGADWNTVYGIPLVNGYSTFVLKDTALYWEYDPMVTPINDIDKVPLNDPRLNEQGVKYISVDKSIFTDKKIPEEMKHFPVVENHTDWAILENPKALPIVHFANQNSGSINLLPGSVNEVNFQLNSNVENDVVIAVAHYPGWDCVVDGKSCALLHEGLGMKVKSNPGVHTYNLTFTPTGWPWLGYVSVVSWLLYLCFTYRYAKTL